MIPFVLNIKTRQIQRQKLDQWLLRAGRVGEKCRETASDTRFLFGVVKMFQNQSGDGYTTL